MPALLSVEIVWIGAKPLMGRMTRPVAKRARHDMAGHQVQDVEVLLFLPRRGIRRQYFTGDAFRFV